MKWCGWPIQAMRRSAVERFDGAVDPETQRETRVFQHLRSEEDQKNIIEQGFTLVELDRKSVV